jgi:hypothetical protein
LPGEVVSARHTVNQAVNGGNRLSTVAVYGRIGVK